MNIAIFSPSKDAYSETFIKAHIDLLPFEVFHYFGGNKPNQLSGSGSIYPGKFLKKGLIRLKKYFYQESIYEQAVIQSLRKHRIKAILAEYGPVGTEAVNVARKLKIPLFVFFHGYDASVQSVMDKYKSKYIDLVNFAEMTFTASSTLSENLQQIGCNSKRMMVNPYGPNDHFFSIQPNYNQSTFFSLGRFVNKKAPYYLLMSLKKVLDDGHTAQLRMGGDGYLLEACINLSKYLGIEEHVEFLGVLNRSQVRSEMENALSFVQHSITAMNLDSEGTPVAILEAGASGLPVIATKHSGIKDVVINNETGFLVEEHDVDGMANAMITLLKDRSKAKYFGQMAKQHISKNYSMERHIQLIAEKIDGSIK